MKTTLTEALVDELAAPLDGAIDDIHAPGDDARRQPVHTVYGGGHLFRADTAPRLGAAALRALEEYAPTPAELAAAIGMDADADLASLVHARVAEKLRREPVEDFRIDFEDGYGHRPDAEEDGHAVAAAVAVARGMAAGTLAPGLGIRIKSVGSETRRRAVRTMDLFLTTLAEETGGALPTGFVFTLPKVAHPAEVAFLADMLQRLERALGLEDGVLAMELMVETPRAVLAADGRAALPSLVEAGRGRVVAAHLGTYDFTAALGVTAAHQAAGHPAARFALRVAQVALAGSRVALSDGATAVLPVAPHRAAAAELTEDQRRENRGAVHAAWRLHASDVRRALSEGIHQGWDLHPAQLVSRYAAVYAFFLAEADAAAARLRNFVDAAAQATRVGAAFDDAATGQGLLNFFLRAAACGALSADEVTARTGLSPVELRSRSFPTILAARAADR